MILCNLRRSFTLQSYLTRSPSLNDTEADDNNDGDLITPPKGEPGWPHTEESGR